MTTQNSRELYERARQVIPNGIYGHYAGPVGVGAPIFFDTAFGSHFTDIDNNTYIDWMCAYGPMILGYGHPAVEKAAADQAAKGNTVSLASPVLVELAEQLVDMVDGVDWALFGKNGADSTNLAVMVARAATGRSKVVKIDGGYHGTSGWMQEPDRPGVAAGERDQVISIAWNDAAALKQAIADHDVACFISSPYHHPVLADNEQPADGYWAEVETACRAAGVAIIVDDVRAGFRLDLAGSHAHYGFSPDLVCFGKALGNGHPIAALTGTDSMRQAAMDVFYTGTQFFSAVPMAAAVATLRELLVIGATDVMTDVGRRLSAGLVDLANAHGFDLVVSGSPAMPYYRIADPSLARREAFAQHSRWIKACVQGGAYLLSYHNNFVSVAHTDDDIATTLDIADRAFGSLRT